MIKSVCFHHRANKWCEDFVAKSSEPDQQFGGLPCIRMDRGARLVIDSNRLSQSPRAFYNKLQLDLHSNPITVIESHDLADALDHIRSKGTIADNGLESRQGDQFFTFQDPNGNGLMVVQK